MLSENEYVVLKKFESVDSIDVDLIPEAVLDILDDKKYIEVYECGCAEYRGFIQFPAKSYCITTSGRDAILAYEQCIKEKSDKKRDKKLDRIFNIFLTLLGFALGVIAEHFGSVISVLSGLF